MRTREVRVVLAVLALAILTAAGSGCATCEPEDPVTIDVTAEPSLNTYDGAAHAMDIYIFKVNEENAFQAAPLDKLKVENSTVSGGQGLNRQNIAPGETISLPIGPMMHEMYTHVGIVAAYYKPEGQQRVVAKIPSDCQLKLMLGSNGIISFSSK